MKRLDKSEIIFKIIAYTFTILFSLMCLYPLVYAVAGTFSGTVELMQGKVILWPVGFQVNAFLEVMKDKIFWITYSNTLFLTFYGTIWSMLVSILGAYALSKKRLLFRKQLNFLLVFTMWFSAGLVPTFKNYSASLEVFQSLGINDPKWLIVIAMGVGAYNIILIRNAFEAVPKEIEEAAIVDGANEFQILTNVYIPMSKASIATVALFYGVSRWNGYFWAKQFALKENRPLQVYIQQRLTETNESINNGDFTIDLNQPHPDSLMYAMILCSIVPILLIYPYIQKYFARGVNLGGVKE